MGKSKKTAQSPLKSKPRQKVVLRKVSASTTAKWRSLPEAVQTSVMSFVEDAVSRYENSGNEEIDETLELIHNQCRRTLAKLNAPILEAADIRSVNSQQEFLLSEEARLKECEAKLAAALEKETRLVADLENEVERLKDLTDDEDSQLHPVLQNLKAVD